METNAQRASKRRRLAIHRRRCVHEAQGLYPQLHLQKSSRGTTKKRRGTSIGEYEVVMKDLLIIKEHGKWLRYK